jgi:hypothetical protein
MAVSCGAVLLAYVLWQEDQAAAPAAAAPLASAATADQGDLV